MSQQRDRKLLRVSLLCGIFALLAFFSVRPSSAHAESPAFIRVIHASPDVGVVDVFVDGNKLLSSFQFGTVTQYVPLPAGGHHVQLALIGTGIDASVVTQNISVSPGVPYTVAALGTKSSGFSLSVFADDNLVSGNNAKVRVYHLSPGTGSVSVTNGEATVVSGLGYQQASSYVSIPSGSYTLNVTVPSNQTVPVSTNLKPWTVTSVFAIGEINGTPKIQFISSQVQGMPGMPGTGSDPNAASENSQLLTPWLFGSLLLLLAIAASVTTRRLTMRTRV